MSAEPLQAAALEPETITIVELTKGFRVDIVALHTASGAVQKMPPTHFPNLALAREFGRRMQSICGYRVEERLRKRGA